MAAPPEQRGYPLLGVLPQLRSEGAIDFFESRRQSMGDVYRIRLGTQSALVVSHPDAFERILAGHKRRYTKMGAYDAARLFMGDNVITLEGEGWKKRRRLMQPYFHRAALKTMIDTMVEVIARSLDDLQQRLPDGGEVDIHQEMVRMTLDVVCTALFGPHISSGSELSYEALMDTVEVMESKMYDPSPLWLPTPRNRKFRRVKAAVDEVVGRFIEVARERLDEPEIASTLLGMLLATRDEEGQPLGDDAIRNEVVGLYIAGHETTALMMTWMFALMPGNDEVMPRIRDEVQTVLGARRPGFGDLTELRYIRQAIDETLRLRNATPMLARNVLEDDNLCGHPVHQGDLVMLWFYGLHRNPAYWPEPERFDPERFSAEAVQGRDPWCYLPFSGGPRVCIGNNFALSEGALITAMMMQRGTWDVLPGQTILPVSEGTLRPSGPVRVRVTWT